MLSSHPVSPSLHHGGAAEIKKSHLLLLLILESLLAGTGDLAYLRTHLLHLALMTSRTCVCIQLDCGRKRDSLWLATPRTQHGECCLRVLLRISLHLDAKSKIIHPLWYTERSWHTCNYWEPQEQIRLFAQSQRFEKQPMARTQLNNAQNPTERNKQEYLF